MEYRAGLLLKIKHPLLDIWYRLGDIENLRYYVVHLLALLMLPGASIR